ncbi:MAG TPA: glycoside hydrolase family 15 protein, partial [Actinobacteria bacterium]|nr:glycoside hydrolase family 15 protein [Actinomycetes bacterium]HEX21734.1 glycoside hydrolase family 15 protein [Actinomycetota bacterium]
MKKYKKLEDYGIIGNLDTAALVGNDGSIDWCCFPHIESPSVFAALLDKDKGGYFSVTPVGPYRSSQNYIDRTNVLQTKFTTSAGSAVLTDFMPLKGWDKADKLSHQAVYRKIVCEQGQIDLAVSFQPRFDYARAKTVLKLDDKGILATSNSEHIFLKSSALLKIENAGAKGILSMKAGDVAWLALQYGHERPLETQNGEELLDKTVQFWLGWVHSCEEQKCVFGGAWHNLIIRSGLVLKLLNHQETGAISAALTTSLPEVIGGNRNWDYRYNWIRDASFTVQALYNVGHIKEAKNHLNWFMG